MISSNFTAELHCQYGQVGVADTKEFQNPTFQEAQDGWLCADGARPPKYGFKPIVFAFHFVKKTEKRWYYNITCENNWDYAGSRLEQNSAGWLGLYGTHVLGRVIDFANPANLVRDQVVWKIETLQPWDGELASAPGIDLYIRDQLGYRVSQVLSLQHYRGNQVKFQFLHAGQREGEILTFNLRNIQLQ